ncbi:MAG: HesA/MoeB/ThiF family protein [Verrucomicrobiae bacterium]|nr:HesA/MoeB/ThiF family protein [Verrucomicrobiae bacterium]
MSSSNPNKGTLTDDDRATYAWQLDVPGFGEAGQEKLRNCKALVSRVGGLGGPLAFSLAAAGVGKLILAHAGDLKPSDLNRQILMTREALGSSRATCATETLHRFKPEIEIVSVAENIAESNVAEMVASADIVFSCAPLFEERLLMNRECVRQNKPLIDSAMFNLEGQVTVVVPGKTACLACLYPEIPPHWKRRFPVIGAVSALVANIGAMEGIKHIAQFGQSNVGHMLLVDTSSMRIDRITLKRRSDCAVCGAESLS